MPARARGRARVVDRRAVLVLCGFTLLSLAAFGHGALDHLGSTFVGSGQDPAFAGRDQGAFTWFLAWGAYVLHHPQNPLVTHLVYAPGGYNLAWAASIPGPALLLAPLTALAGAIPVFNLLALLAPALAAWTAYLFCAELVGARVPAVVGGLLFGFGTYESAETVNHLNLALVALLPLLPLLAVRRWRGLTSTRRYVLTAGAVAAAQLWTSTEVFASAVVFGAIALAIAALTAPRADRSLALRLIAESLGAIALAGLLGAPLLWTAFGPNPVGSHYVVNAGADLANFLVPTRVTWLHQGVGLGGEGSLGANISERAGYLGPLLILLLVWLAIAHRRSRLARGVLLFGVFAALLSLGGQLIVFAHNTRVTLPWGLIGQVGPLKYALPNRFAVYMWLAIAAAIALLLRGGSSGPVRALTRARIASGLRWAAAVAACASVFPNATGFAWATRTDSPPLLRSTAFHGYIPPGSTVLALPFGIEGDSMLWQVEGGLSFKLAGGYVSWALPREYARLTIIRELRGRPPRGRLEQRLCSFLAMTHAQTILLREHTPGDWRATLATLHEAPAHAGGFEIYRVSGSSCVRGFG